MVRVVNANIYTPVGKTGVKGAKMGELLHIPNGELVFDEESGIITYVGPKRRSRAKYIDEIDAEGKVVLPGFVDSHTHLVFGGLRADEFKWRMRGDSYMSIMERGGGIVNTVESTAKASEEELIENASRILADMKKMGITTAEIKTGYGLDHDTEMKQTIVINSLMLGMDDVPNLNIVCTYLGAHALPKKFAPDGHDKYIDFIISEMLPELSMMILRPKFVDVFCEKGVFSIEQSRRLLTAAKKYGFGIKLHADEMACTGGAELAAELGAVSADHLLHVSDAGIQALAKSNTIATLLPLTAFTLREEYAPARKMIDAGCAVALASDINPGSCYSCSVPLIIALACIYMHMTIEEVITALTLNGAAALGLADRIGSLEVGKKADFNILTVDNIDMLPYYTAMNCVAATYVVDD